jgi:RNA-directed DNA polymerase
LLQPIIEGTPQDGVISPILANATLDGMERMFKVNYKASHVNGKLYCPKVNFVGYPDDFIVTADKRVTLLEIKEMLTTFLKERGSTISDKKTLITLIGDGFDFFGFNVQEYDGTLIIKRSKKNQRCFTDKPHEVVLTKGKALSQQDLIEKLNPTIR